MYGLARYYTGLPGRDLYDRHYTVTLAPGAGRLFYILVDVLLAIALLFIIWLR